MIGLDTNVLVRYLVQDDVDQGRRATEALGRLTVDNPGVLTQVVLVELYWVLTRAYDIPRDRVLDVLSDLVDRDEIFVDHRTQTLAALQRTRDGADLADALVVESCRAAGAREVITLDKDAVSYGMTLI